MAESLLKALNIKKVGSITQDGTVFSNFSYAKYLNVGTKIDKGVVSLDSSVYVKDFDNIFMYDNYEMCFKTIFYGFSSTTEFQPIWAERKNWPISWLAFCNKNSQYQILFYNSSNSAMETYLPLGQVADGTVIYVKLVYDGTKYVLSSSFDGVDFSNSVTINYSTPFPRGSYEYFLGSTGYSVSGTTRYMRTCKLDIAGCYVKTNGEYWWRGVGEI